MTYSKTGGKQLSSKLYFTTYVLDIKYRMLYCHNTLSKIILQGIVNGGRRRGRPRKLWKDNIEEWTGQSMSSLLRVAEDRDRWATIAAEASVGVPQRRIASWAMID